MEELKQFIIEQEAYLQQKYPDLFKDPEKAAYARVAKLSEEVGELSEAVLHYFNLQRKVKDAKDMSIGSEIADIIIVVLVFARQLDIDIDKYISDKIKVLKQRRKLDS